MFDSNSAISSVEVKKKRKFSSFNRIRCRCQFLFLPVVKSTRKKKKRKFHAAQSIWSMSNSQSVASSSKRSRRVKRERKETKISSKIVFLLRIERSMLLVSSIQDQKISSTQEKNVRKHRQKRSGGIFLFSFIHLDFIFLQVLENRCTIIKEFVSSISPIVAIVIISNVLVVLWTAVRVNRENVVSTVVGFSTFI